MPASVRKRLGIQAGDVLILDERRGEMVLRPAVVVELELYTDEQITEWEEEDRLKPGEREEIRAKATRLR